MLPIPDWHACKPLSQEGRRDRRVARSDGVRPWSVRDGWITRAPPTGVIRIAARSRDMSAQKRTCHPPRLMIRIRFYLSAFTTPSPMVAGLSETVMPASRRALIFETAVPSPPEMIAPACPMRLPGGAV